MGRRVGGVVMLAAKYDIKSRSPLVRRRALRVGASHPQLGNATTHLGRLPGLLFPSQAGSMDDAAWDKLFVAGAKTPYTTQKMWCVPAAPAYVSGARGARSDTPLADPADCG
jgi:hypothetical protein